MNINDFSFERKGITFRFRNPGLDKYDKLVFEYKIDGIKDKDDNDGYFYNAEFDIKAKAIRFYNVKINDKNVDGVLLNGEILDKVIACYEKLKKDREIKIEDIVQEIVDGSRYIDFSIVGCDFPQYQSWINEIPKDLEGQEHLIMDKAIKKYSKGEIVTSSPCEFFRNKLKQRITTKDDIRKDAVNLKLDKEVQQYHGYSEDVVTSFQLNISDLIDFEQIESKLAKKRAREEYKNTLKLTVLNSGKNDDDIYADIEIEDPITNDKLKFCCRNIFDFGYVVNPSYEITGGISGGLRSGDMWQTFKTGEGWTDVRELTEFEKKCVDYLNEFPPIHTHIRL